MILKNSNPSSYAQIFDLPVKQEAVMGGNALKNTNTVRVDTPTLNLAISELQQYFETHYPMLQVEPVKSYRSKPSHGDLDLVYSVKPEYANETNVHFTHFVDSHIKSLQEQNLEYKNNGPVLSFPYDLGHNTYLQIDLIRTQPETFELAQCYFNYNDLSNLLGRMTKKLGFKLGHNGLFYIERMDDHIISDICFSTNYYDALRYLELDVTKYKQGFDTLEEIFDYVASSPYFNPEIFLLHNRNHISRTRDKKRKTYQAFLEYCERNKDNLTHYLYDKVNDYNGYGSTNNTRIKFTQKLLEDNPLLHYQVLTNRANYVLDKEFKKYFNRHIVKAKVEETFKQEITNKQLSKIMPLLKHGLNTQRKLQTVQNQKFTISKVEYLFIRPTIQGKIK